MPESDPRIEKGSQEGASYWALLFSFCVPKSFFLYKSMRIGWLPSEVLLNRTIFCVAILLLNSASGTNRCRKDGNIDTFRSISEKETEPAVFFLHFLPLSVPCFYDPL